MRSRPATCEVAIIGAGPAGTSLALALLRAGLKPVVIDQAHFPRNKVCAGGLTVKALKFLPPDIGSVLENEISQVNLSFNLGRAFTKAHHQPLLHTVNRTRFDAYLAARVKQAGGDCREGEPVQRLTAAPGAAPWTVETSRGCFKAHVVVGADGARSGAARSAGLQPVDFWHLGIQAEVPIGLISKGSLEFTRAIFLDMGSIPDGYAWGFPRGDLVAIGVGGPLVRGQELRRYLARVLSVLGVDEPHPLLAAHLIPHRVSPRPIVRGRLLLVGDAAGLTDFWTGEGIFYALKSANLAAQQILKFFQGDAAALNEYQTLVDQEITPDLTASYQFSKIFNYIGPLAFRCLKRYDYPWEVFCRIMRGDRSFSEIKKRFRPDIFCRKLLIKSARNRPLI